MNDLITDIIKTHWNKLKKKKNVKYFSGSLKNKIINNEEIPGRLCFRIYVTRKEPVKALSKDDLIPRFLEVRTKVGYSTRNIKIETDVYPIGEIKIHEVCRTSSRPVKAGCSAMNYQGTACTLGWFGRNKKEGEEEFIGIICNAHCGGRECKAKKGEAYLYPSPYDGGTLENKIAIHWRHYLSDYIDFKCPYRNFLHKIKKLFIKTKPTPVDASLEKLVIPLDEVSYEIFKIGTITGKRRGKLGELGEKVGRTTGYTSNARLIDNDWYGIVQYGRGTIMRGPSGLLEGNNFSAGGDSSSAVRWMKDKQLAGLLYGGSDTHTVFDHYDLIEKYLEVELIVPK